MEHHDENGFKFFKDIDLKLSFTSIKVPRKLAMCNYGVIIFI
jgi:hypothetical protein